jgi:hypothetical protein
MTKPTWIIDSKLRMAYYGDGVTVEFHRADGEWTAKLQSRFDDHSGPASLDDETLKAEALGLWQEQIDTALGFLRFAGTTMHGEDWIAPLAKDMGISPTKIQGWLNQDEPLAMNSAQWPMVLRAMVDQQEKIGDAIEKVRSAFYAAKVKAGKPWVKRLESGDPWSGKPFTKPFAV